MCGARTITHRPGHDGLIVKGAPVLLVLNLNGDRHLLQDILIRAPHVLLLIRIHLRLSLDERVGLCVKRAPVHELPGGCPSAPFFFWFVLLPLIPIFFLLTPRFIFRSLSQRSLLDSLSRSLSLSLSSLYIYISLARTWLVKATSL